MRLWENRPCMGFLLIISITIVGIIYGVDKLQQDSNVTRPKRSLEKDTCLTKYGGIELDYVENSAMSFTFDICSVFNCQGKKTITRVLISHHLVHQLITDALMKSGVTS